MSRITPMDGDHRHRRRTKCHCQKKEFGQEHAAYRSWPGGVILPLQIRS